MEEKLIKLLYDEDILSAEQYEQVQKEIEASGESCEQILERLNILNEAEILAFLGKKSRLQVVDWDAFSPDEELFTLLPEESARKYMVFPLMKEQGKRQAKLTLAVADPFDIRVNDDLAFMTGCTIKTMLASSHTIREAIQRYYAEEAAVPQPKAAPVAAESSTPEDTLSSTGISAVDTLLGSIMQQLKSEEEDVVDPLAGPERENPSIKLLIDLLKLSAEHGYSEIHIEPCDSQYTIRIAQHGILRKHTNISAQIGQGIATRLRRRLQLPPKASTPQSGAFSTTLAGERSLQVQVYFYPTISGEKVQLCLKNIAEFDTLEQLGIDEMTHKTLGRLIARPQGQLLLVSPPRQGKTTTLYALLHKLCQGEARVLSLEASIMRSLPKINQLPFKSEHSYQQWCSLIAFQAPQILALDHPAEIDMRRRLAFEFAPGSLVLMTVTATDAANGICQLLSQCCGPQNSETGRSLMLDSINGLFSQRLIRTLCPHCKKEASLSQQDLLLLKRLSAPEGGLGNFTNYTAQGCAECQSTGYAGQIGLFEVIKFDKNLKQKLLPQQTICAHRIRQYCAEATQGNIREQAFQLLREGRSSLAEIRRALQH